MTTLTALPPAPQRSDPANFATLADAWVSALEDTFTPEMNLIIPEINALAVSAGTDATTATTQAGIALTKAGEASISAASALDSRNEAYDLVLLYLGASTTDPTVGKESAALVAGNWYINSVTGFIRAYTGSAWVNGISATAGVTSVNGLTGAVVNIATTNTVQTLTNKTIIETVFALTGTTPALLMTNGSVQTWALSGASSPTDSLIAGASIILVITPGAFTITWPSVVWTKQGGSGVAPTLFSAGKTTVVLWKINSTLYGSHLGDTV